MIRSRHYGRVWWVRATLSAEAVCFGMKGAEPCKWKMAGNAGTSDHLVRKAAAEHVGQGPTHVVRVEVVDRTLYRFRGE